MDRLLTRLILTLAVIGFLTASDDIEARSLGELLKALGHSIAHPHQRAGSARGDREKESKPSATKDATGAAVTSAGSVPPVQPTVRAASAAPEAKGVKRDVPYGIPIPNKPGFVTSPYAPEQGVVDVRGFLSGTEVKDPYSGRIFLTP